MFAGGRPLILAMLVVVVTFGGSLGYSHFRLGAIEREASVLESRVTPAMEHLTAAREALFRLTVDTDELVLGTDLQRAAARRRLENARSQLDGELALYRTIRPVPSEASTERQVHGRMAAVDDALHNVLIDAATAATQQAERDAHIEQLDAELDALGDDLQRLLDVDVAAVRAEATEIVSTRESARRTVILLGAVSLAAAIVATALALKTLRTQARLVAERRVFLESRAQELEAFAGRVAHDLRSPLATMALQISAFERRADSDPKLKLLGHKLAQRIEGMNAVVDDLLRFASGGAQPEPGARTEAQALLQQIGIELEPALGAAGAELHIEQAASVVVACAEGALRSVLTNLLQNAISHIDGGARSERRITARTILLDDGAVRIEIEDTGPGLPPGTERIVFDPFVRLDATRGRGIGLGLSTVKKIAEAHGGRAGVQSIYGHGSCFYVELPLAPTAASLDVRVRRRSPA